MGGAAGESSGTNPTIDHKPLSVKISNNEATGSLASTGTRAWSEVQHCIPSFPCIGSWAGCEVPLWQHSCAFCSRWASARSVIRPIAQWFERTNHPASIAMMAMMRTVRLLRRAFKVLLVE